MNLNWIFRNVSVCLINMSNRPADILLSSETENILEIEHSLRGGGGSPVKFGQIKEIKSEEKKGNHQ